MKPAARAGALAVALWLGGCAVGADTGARVAVEFVNASQPTRCAEEDNVYVKVQMPLAGAAPSAVPGAKRFRIRAEHPPYIGSIREDSTAPDFTDCDMSSDPRFVFVPREVVLYEDAAIRLVGHTFPTFWRPEVVEFQVGDRREAGLHLVQLLKRDVETRVGAARGRGRDVEILVVYPSDGYWRAKPLPPYTLADSAYGSSFLVGPIAEDGRPFVPIRTIVFDPARLTFRLAFRDGSHGTLRVSAATRRAVELTVTLDKAVPAGRPFAALRSMFVHPAQADVAIAAWPAGTPAAAAAAGAGTAPILAFTRVGAPAARFGRVEPSRHNLSAPDMVFDRFVLLAAPAAPH